MKRAQSGELFMMASGMLALLTIGLVSTFNGAKQMQLERILASRGVHVQAVVVRRREWGYTGGEHSDGSGQELVVRYPVGDSYRTVRLSCTWQTYDVHKVGSMVEVVFDASAPDNVLFKNGLGTAGWTIAAFGVLCLLGTVGLPIGCAVYWNRRAAGP